LPLVAIVREPSASLAECELSYLHRTSIDLDRARAQHAGYCAALRAAGAEVLVLPALDDLPDAAFVEDTAVVVDEVAVLGALGVASRAAEPEMAAPALAAFRPVTRIDVPGATLEGGDVLRVDRTLYVGRSGRTNDAGSRALASLLEPLGYRVRALRVQECLHLKTACTYAGEGVMVLNPAWVDAAAFRRDGLEVLPVAPAEPWAANTLRLGGKLLVPAGNRVTSERLRGAGLRPVEVDIGEFQKAEAGLTCLSLLIDRRPTAG
jgi:dimethylargininase